MVLEAVDTEFAGHELGKSPVCGVWCGNRLCSPGTLGSPKQQVLQALWTCIGVGLLLAASQLLRVRWRECRNGDLTNARDADICVTSWPHIAQGNWLYALHMHWMPHAEQDVFAKKGKIDRKHMAGAEL